MAHILRAHNPNNNENDNITDSLYNMDNDSSLESATAPTTISYPVRSGTITTFDVTPKSCEPFGFYCGERVHVRGGKTAWVIGVRDNNLFFHIDGDKGASYYCNHSKQHFLRDGFKLLSPRFVCPSHLNTLNHNNNNNNNARNVHVAPAFKSLVGDKSFADVNFQVGDKLIAAHKNILVTRSDYFRAMFSHGMKENNQNIILLPNVEVDTFTAVLEFLYTGHVTVDERNIVSLITAAAIFRIDDLKELCLLQFNTVVSEFNVINLLLVADKHHEEQLKKTCKRYIMDNYQDMLQTDSFKQLISPENSDLLLELMSYLTPPENAKSKKRKI